MRAVNLLPRDGARKSAGLSVQLQATIIGPVLVAVLLGAGWFVTRTQVNDHRATLTALRAELRQLPKPKKKPHVDPALRAQRDQRVAALADALSQRVAWDRILRQISSILPEDVWLTGIDAQSPAVDAAPAPTATTPTTTDATPTSTTSTPPPPPPTSSSGQLPLVINGYTYSQEGVARFLARLSVIPDLDGVTLVSSQLTDGQARPVVQFVIQSNLRAPGASS